MLLKFDTFKYHSFDIVSSKSQLAMYVVVVVVVVQAWRTYIGLPKMKC